MPATGINHIGNNLSPVTMTPAIVHIAGGVYSGEKLKQTVANI
jgi:hypothetical protein